jgi:hypothetical protein
MGKQKDANKAGVLTAAGIRGNFLLVLWVSIKQIKTF